MAESHVVSALKRKYAVIAGQLRASQVEAERMRADLAHIAATLRMFTDEDPEGIKPTTPPTRCKWFANRQCSRAVLEILRAADAALTLREITERVIEHCKLQGVDEAAFRSIQDSVKHALAESRGRLLEADDGSPLRWKIRD